MAKNRFNINQTDFACKSWQLTKANDIGIIDQYGGEALAIGGADLNIFKLLGVHEQGKLVDLTGNGVPISGGTAGGYTASNAFISSTCNNIWRSSQQGLNDIITNAYIGYNFGTPKLDNGRTRYGVDVDIKEHITTIKIQQSSNPARRVTSARVERSDDGITWLGVAIVSIPDDEHLNQISFKQSAATRYWRLRPLSFTGTDADFWEIITLELIDWDETNLFQVQDDYGWIENRDRDYADKSITIKGFYDLYEKESDLTQWGFGATGSLYYMTVNFNDVVNRIGRPLVIGDIMEVPSEAMFDPNMTSIQKYLEVTDVSWSAEGYAPGWQPTLLRVIAEPMLAKQETQDIIGHMAGAIDQSGLLEIDQSKYSELATNQSERAREKAEQEVPLRGGDSSGLTSFEQDEIAHYQDSNINISKISVNQKGLYVEDGIPKNGDSYTEGNDFPPTPSDGDYHRLTYNGLAEGMPPRLHRFSIKKGRWIFLEADRRVEYDPQKPSLQTLKNSRDAISMKNLGK